MHRNIQEENPMNTELKQTIKEMHAKLEQLRGYL